MNMLVKSQMIIVWPLFAFVMLGSFYLMYLQNIDGVFINRPFTFASNIDPLKFKTDKQVYHKGDPVSILTSVCKNRNYSVQTTWKLVNATVITYPSKGTIISGVGCVVDKYILIGDIPSYAKLGTHHLEGTAAVMINPLRTIYYNYRSQDFEVI